MDVKDKFFPQNKGTFTCVSSLEMPFALEMPFTFTAFKFLVVSEMNSFEKIIILEMRKFVGTTFVLQFCTRSVGDSFNRAFFFFFLL